MPARNPAGAKGSAAAELAPRASPRPTMANEKPAIRRIFRSFETLSRGDNRKRVIKFTANKAWSEGLGLSAAYAFAEIPLRQRQKGHPEPSNRAVVASQPQG